MGWRSGYPADYGVGAACPLSLTSERASAVATKSNLRLDARTKR